MESPNAIQDNKYAHSFTISVDTPFGQEDYLLLIDELSQEAEISTQRGSAKFKNYKVDGSSFSANFDIDTPMTASVAIQFSKTNDSDEFSGSVSVGKFLCTSLKAKRHQ